MAQRFGRLYCIFLSVFKWIGNHTIVEVRLFLVIWVVFSRMIGFWIKWIQIAFLFWNRRFWFYWTLFVAFLRQIIFCRERITTFWFFLLFFILFFISFTKSLQNFCCKRVIIIFPLIKFCLKWVLWFLSFSNKRVSIGFLALVAFMKRILT